MTDWKLYNPGRGPCNYCYHGFWIKERVITSWRPKSPSGKETWGFHVKGSSVSKAWLGQVGLR